MSSCLVAYYGLEKAQWQGQMLSSLKGLSAQFDLVIDQVSVLSQDLNVNFPKHLQFLTPAVEGTQKELEWDLINLWAEGQSSCGIVLIGKVIASSHLSEKKLKDLATFLEAVIDSVAGSVYWKDKNGVYLGCNKAFVEKSGFDSKADVVGKTDYQLWPEHAKEICKFDQEVMFLDKTLESQEVVKIHNSENFYFASIKMPLKDDNGNIVGVIGNSLDVTELIKSKFKAEEINRIKTEFILNMQHDIKTPISHIIGLSDMLSNREEISPEIKEYITYIKVSSERLMDLIIDIMQFANVEVGNTLREETCFNLFNLIQSIVDLNGIGIKKKSLSVLTEYDPNLPPLLSGDQSKLHRVILNLFGNALKFTSHGSIKIAVKVIEIKMDKMILEISIQDSGIGIPMDKQEIIFDRFTRLSSSDCNLYQGLGLGLWIVKQFVEDMGGRISVHSEPNQGSTFTCVLPFKIPGQNQVSTGAP